MDFKADLERASQACHWHAEPNQAAMHSYARDAATTLLEHGVPTSAIQHYERPLGEGWLMTVTWYGDPPETHPYLRLLTDGMTFYPGKRQADRFGDICRDPLHLHPFFRWDPEKLVVWVKEQIELWQVITRSR